MAGFAQRLDIAADSFRERQGPVAWAARNCAKPGRTGAETWVIHASPQRSRDLLDEDKDEVARLLLADFCEMTGASAPEPVHLAAHRWLYAMPASLGGEAARYDREARIGIAGDWLHSPRVEGAFLSGRALAEAVLAAT
jgi:predicted NAD/FAD-dependent oxidoreductase